MLSYKMDNKGVSTITRTEQHIRNSKLNFLLVIVGIIARNPTAAGAAFLTHSGQDQDLKWKNIRKATFYPASSTIKVSAGYGEKSIVFCTKENYGSVSGFVRAMCNGSCQIRGE